MANLNLVNKQEIYQSACEKRGKQNNKTAKYAPTINSYPFLRDSSLLIGLKIIV